MASQRTPRPLLGIALVIGAASCYIAFGVAPDGWGWVGMAIIGVCGAASAWLNVRAAADTHRPVSTVQVDTIAE